MQSELIPYREKCDELVRLTYAEHVPVGVVDACLSLRDDPSKFFVHVGHCEGARRATDPEPGLYASNFLLELVAALKASNWPEVMILVHDCLTNSLSELQEKMRHRRLGAVNV